MSRLLKADKQKNVFLGGTCAETTWRDKLIPILNIDFFDPRVDDWNKQAQEKEVYEREHCDYCLYTITPKMQGVYSIAEVTQDSNIRPEKTILCLLKEDEDKNFDESQWKSLEQVAKMIKSNGAKVFYNINDVANYLNDRG